MSWTHLAEAAAAIAVTVSFLLATVLYVAMREIIARDEILEDYVEAEIRIW